MGLDMYLERHICVFADYLSNVTGKCEITGECGSAVEHFEAPVNKIFKIVVKEAQWRKANQIHKWFVDNVQRGNDDCGEYYVSYEQLLQLKKLCGRILKEDNLDKRIECAKRLLPVSEGFFFGSQEYDDMYFDDIKYTYDTLSKLKPAGLREDFRYLSSW